MFHELHCSSVNSYTSPAGLFLGRSTHMSDGKQSTAVSGVRDGQTFSRGIDHFIYICFPNKKLCDHFVQVIMVCACL